MSASAEKSILREPGKWSDNDHFGDVPGFFFGETPEAVAARDAKEVVDKFAEAIRRAIQNEQSA